ncbi:MAG TPA: ABC transporter substrate-binding protein, partial [Candidatus Dormibacteraeota bacterium]|nr:ABC transporter substrate-binding protein [Candidatus Dormibacteraeota bacterium]
PVTPNFRVPQQIVHPEGAIVPVNKNFDSTPPVGSGPFKVVSFTPGQSAVFERNDDYWGTKAMVKTINLRFLPDNQTRVQALQSGQVDFIIGLPPLSVAAVQSDSRFRVIQSKFGRNQLIYIDQDGKAPHSIGADPAVRQAVSVAIDRAAYVKTVFDNNADPGRWMSPNSVLGASADLVKAVPFDQNRANSVLDGAGWTQGSGGIRSKNGVQLSLDLIGWAEVTSVAFQFLQSQLQAVGIQANIKAAADTPTYNNYYKNTQFDLDLEVPNQNDGNPAFLPILRMYSKNPGTGHFAPGGEFDTLAAGTFTTTDVPAVQQAAAQMMQLLINEQYIVVPLAGVRRIFGMKSNITLGDPHPSLTNQVWTSLAVYKS